MRVERHDDVDGLLATAGDWLVERETEHHLLLGICDGLRRNRTPRAPPLLLSIHDDGGGLVGVAAMTPPHRLVVSALPAAAIDALLDGLAAHGPPIPGVHAPLATADALSAAWVARFGGARRVRTHMVTYALTELVHPPRPAPGALRLATDDDLPLAIAWMKGFGADIGEPVADDAAALGLVRRHTDVDGLFLWDEAGQPTSMAAASARTPNGVRISAVYTPAELRGAGRASACVAALCRRRLDEGRRFCFLYADVANPTSNAIYARLGFERGAEFRDWRFVPA